jgi:capsular exopolysaccharide synthesis family protein
MNKTWRKSLAYKRSQLLQSVLRARERIGSSFRRDDEAQAPDLPTSPFRPFSREAGLQFDQLVAWLLVKGDSGVPFTLAITSTVYGEGVSTVCAGLGCELARSTSKRIVLLDTDLRSPTLHQLFDVPSIEGFHEYVLADQEHRKETLTPVPIHGFGLEMSALWLVPGGAATPNPSHLTTSEAAKRAVRRLQGAFDYVLIDCPPVLPAAETASLCRLADGVVMVVRAGLTPQDDVLRARRALVGVPLVGVVLNGT